jgi:hypothetical protein
MAARVVKESLRAMQMFGSVACRQPQISAWCASTAPAASVLVPSANRLLHSSAHSSALAKVVTDELKYEKDEMEEQGAEVDSALKNPPSGWKLDYKKSQTAMMLSKMLDKENIIIRVNTLSSGEPSYDESNPDGEEDESMSVPTMFTVDCVKDNTALRFDCEYIENDDADPSIIDVSLVPNVDQEATLKELEPNTYAGPRYHELDEKLQNEFSKYILDRGIDADMGQYLCRLIYDKEQEDYVNWLERLKIFTSK